MKQKYQISVTDDDRLLIREYAELDKDSFSLLCEEAYEKTAVENAIQLGSDALMTFLRTKNMYPPGIYAGPIAGAVREMISAGGEDARELMFDDVDLLSKGRAVVDFDEDIDEEPELDDLLGDELDEEYDEKDEIKNVKTSIKISEDDSDELEEEA